MPCTGSICTVTQSRVGQPTHIHMERRDLFGPRQESTSSGLSRVCSHVPNESKLSFRHRFSSPADGQISSMSDCKLTIKFNQNGFPLRLKRGHCHACCVSLLTSYANESTMPAAGSPRSPVPCLRVIDRSVVRCAMIDQGRQTRTCSTFEVFSACRLSCMPKLYTSQSSRYRSQQVNKLNTQMRDLETADVHARLPA